MADVMSYVRCSCCKKIAAAVEEAVLDMGKMLVYHGSYTEILLEFPSMTEEWLDFIIACREGKPHDYDIVIGAMANDQIYNYVADYIAGIITRKQFWALAKFKYPTHQINFCSKKAIECLSFEHSEMVKQNERQRR